MTTLNYIFGIFVIAVIAVALGIVIGVVHWMLFYSGAFNDQNKNIKYEKDRNRSRKRRKRKANK